MLVLIIALSGIVIAATIFDVHRNVTNPEPSKFTANSDKATVEPSTLEPSKWEQRLLCFSAHQNFKDLFARRNSGDTFEIFNAARVMSMGWVIFGHICLSRGWYRPLTFP